LEKVDLDRYELTGRLGVGADYEVRAAVDRETGNLVAIKRPVPQAISRNQHEAIEARTEKVLQAYQEVGFSTKLISPILGYTGRAVHDDFFGDELGKEYQVIVEERASGIPLLGDMMSKFKGVPIGAGQNLFTLFPLVQPSAVPAHAVQNQLLDLEEVYLSAGYVVLDLRPQNIFYQPGNGQMVVIDTGALARLDGEAPRGRPPYDINDACLEILKFYTTPVEPPDDSKGYREARGIRPIINIEEELAEMARDLADCASPVVEVGTVILGKIRDRAYTEYAKFRTDLTAYLDRINERNAALENAFEANRTWREAALWLKEDYWRDFLFDPDSELAGYLA
jgi:serine/threonine protein kinase